MPLPCIWQPVANPVIHRLHRERPVLWLRLLPCGVLSLLPLPVSAMFLIAFIVLAIWAAELAESIVGQKDPGCIVIDEFAGMMITLLGIHFTWQSALAGFFIFRVMDILKPFPIRYLERTIPGGAGIVMDDVAAGVAAHLVLRLLLSVTLDDIVIIDIFDRVGVILQQPLTVNILYKAVITN